MNTRIIKLFLIFILSFSLFSCIDIDTEIIIRQNLSGEVLIKYSISKAAINIGKIDKYDNFFPLPIEEQRYRELAAGVNGLELRSFRMEETESEILINARFEFRNIDALNAIVANSNNRKIEVQRRGDRTYYIQRISDNSKPISEEVKQLAQALFHERAVKLKLTAPQAIRTVNAGTSTGSSAQVSYDLTQLLSAPAPISWEVSW